MDADPLGYSPPAPWKSYQAGFEAIARLALPFGIIAGASVFTLAAFGYLRGLPILCSQAIGIVVIIAGIAIWLATRRRKLAGKDSWYVPVPEDPDYFHAAAVAIEKQLRDRR